MDISINRRGAQQKLSDIGIRAKDFILSSIGVESSLERIEGRDGFLETDVTLGSRTIIVPFYFEAVDLLDFPLLRDELFRMITSREQFYIQEIRNKNTNGYKFTDTTERAAERFTENQELSHKRYLVRLTNVIEIEQSGRTGEGELVFTTVGLPFAESEGTTLDELTFTREVWQVGQGLILEEPKYTHNTISFSIFNAGDVTVDPRQFPLKIIYRGASTNLQIRNNTTSDVWTYSGSSGTSDQLTLDGVRSLKNGVSIFGDTNKNLISIAPGWNDFTLTGTSGSFLISFEHRFYYY